MQIHNCSADALLQCMFNIDLQIQIVHFGRMNKAITGRNGRVFQPDAMTDTAVVEVKNRLSAVRTVRDGLVQLAMMLVCQPRKRGYLLLIDPQLSGDSLVGEVEGFKAAMRPEIADHLMLVVAKSGEILQPTIDVPPSDLELLRHCIDESFDSGAALPSADKQSEVFLVILHQWITGQGPMTSRWLEEMVGCNYRTVWAAIERLGPALKRYSDRRISLKYFPEQDWKRFLVVAHKARSAVYYADTSDQPRSPESLVRRLGQFGRKDIAVGGVIGAKRYYPDLDIVGTPRLDLCVHAPGTRMDLDFVKQLDPAFEQTSDPHRPARLAIHFVRRKEPLFDREKDGSIWPDPVECLVELFNARLDQQAVSFQEFLTTRGRELSGES